MCGRPRILVAKGMEKKIVYLSLLIGAEIKTAGRSLLSSACVRCEVLLEQTSHQPYCNVFRSSVLFRRRGTRMCSQFRLYKYTSKP